MSEETEKVPAPIMVDGYCINWGNTGIPELQPCTVQKLTVGTELAGFLVAVQIEPGVIAGLTEGEDFFTEFQPAVQAHIKALKDARFDHWKAVAYIEDLIEVSEEVLRMGDEPCH